MYLSTDIPPVLHSLANQTSAIFRGTTDTYPQPLTGASICLWNWPRRVASGAPGRPRRRL